MILKAKPIPRPVLPAQTPHPETLKPKENAVLRSVFKFFQVPPPSDGMEVNLGETSLKGADLEALQELGSTATDGPQNYECLPFNDNYIYIYIEIIYIYIMVW